MEKVMSENEPAYHALLDVHEEECTWNCGCAMRREDGRAVSVTLCAMHLSADEMLAACRKAERVLFSVLNTTDIRKIIELRKDINSALTDCHIAVACATVDEVKIEQKSGEKSSC